MKHLLRIIWCRATHHFAFHRKASKRIPVKPMISSLSVMFYSTTRRLASSSTNAKKIIVKISSDCITASYRFIGNEPPQLRSFKLELVAWMHLVAQIGSIPHGTAQGRQKSLPYLIFMSSKECDTRNGWLWESKEDVSGRTQDIHSCREPPRLYNSRSVLAFLPSTFLNHSTCEFIGFSSFRFEMARVIDKYDDELLTTFETAEVLAMDVEGVDLGRKGKVSLVQIADHKKCLLVDLLNKDKDDRLVTWLKSLLEDKKIRKVIHDVKMDFDALFHLFNIRLTNVHDTTVWHQLISGQINKSLNDVLAYNGLTSNVNRDASVYLGNASFWATRPLTSQMIDWASGDVGKLLDLYEKQIRHENIAAAAEKKTAEQMNFIMNAKTGVIQVEDRGRFYGRGGQNLRAIQTATNTLVYHRGDRSRNDFLVYYVDPSSLERVRQEGQSRFVSRRDDDFF